jgi:hypothetical protein
MSLAAANQARQTKDAERRDKMSVRAGEKSRQRQGLEKSSKTAAMLKTAPLACE